MKQIKKFSPEAIEKLKNYVYRLIDPRNGETFYVGVGVGNRVFQHIKGAVLEDNTSEKITRIHQITNSGFNVSHIIHRHGMTKSVATEVEAALIEAYPGLTNSIGGHGSNDYGVMHASEIESKYNAEEASFDSHKILLISVNKSVSEKSLYDSVRFAWRLNKNKASKADYVFATVQGIIKGVYIAESWLEATVENFPNLMGLESDNGRYGFIGFEAENEIKEMYIGKRTPEKFRKRGASNPIKYSY